MNRVLVQRGYIDTLASVFICIYAHADDGTSFVGGHSSPSVMCKRAVDIAVGRMAAIPLSALVKL